MLAQYYPHNTGCMRSQRLCTHQDWLWEPWTPPSLLNPNRKEAPQQLDWSPFWMFSTQVWRASASVCMWGSGGSWRGSSSTWTMARISVLIEALFTNVTYFPIRTIRELTSAQCVCGCVCVWNAHWFMLDETSLLWQRIKHTINEEQHFMLIMALYKFSMHQNIIDSRGWK